MNALARKHAKDIDFALTGFDRLIFRGTLRTLAAFQLFGRWLSHYGILLKDFGDWSVRITEELEERSLAQAQQQGRPIEYLGKAASSKEALARAIAQRHSMAEGTVCIFKTLETCASYEIHRNRDTKKLELQPKIRQCQVLYPYWIDGFWGWMNARIQTGVPFSIQICVNGREWLAQRLRENRIPFEQWDNGFIQWGDPVRAQVLMNKVFRESEGKPGLKHWLPMRKGVADLKRRADLSDKANERYLDALGLLSTGQCLGLGALVNPLCRSITRNGRPIRGLRPWRADERELLAAVARPEWNLTGFRNRNLAAILYPKTTGVRQTTNRVGRLIRMLRAHGLVHKMPHTHRYQLSPLGKEVTATILQTQSITSEDLRKLAA